MNKYNYNLHEILDKLPDKVVIDDIKNYLTNKTGSHLFSNIYEGKTLLSPDNFIKYRATPHIIYLYSGGCGQGNYINIAYSFDDNKYIYVIINAGENPRTAFKSENWEEFHAYVCKDLHNLFTWFKK